MQLQELNGIKLGFTLHSRHSSTNITQHIFKEMKQKILKNINETNAKCSILIDESTTLSALCGMVVYLKVAIANNEPLFIFLDLVELKSQASKKNGVAKKLKDKYPLIFSWHCMNHRIKLAVNDSLKI